MLPVSADHQGKDRAPSLKALCPKNSLFLRNGSEATNGADVSIVLRHCILAPVTEVNGGHSRYNAWPGAMLTG